MAKTKLIIDGSGNLQQNNVELSNNNSNIILESGAELTIGFVGGMGVLNLAGTLTISAGRSSGVGQININGGTLVVKGSDFIEVKGGGVLNIINNDLALEDIVATSGTIQLNNIYTGNAKPTIQVGNNSIISLTGTELPLSTVTIEKDAIFSFIHNNTGMQINTLNGAINTPNLVIKDIHTVVDTANFLNNIFNNAQGFQGNVTEGIAARIYKKNKEAVKLFMTQNNMACSDVAIDQYFDQKYLITSALAQEQDNWGDFAYLPLDVVGNIFSESAYI